VLVSVANETYHVMPSEAAVTLESITAFVGEFLEGTLEPTLRSAEAPLHEEGPVRTLVARDFRRRVYESPKDVLVLFRCAADATLRYPKLFRCTASLFQTVIFPS
jgi:hypothetical protein